MDGNSDSVVQSGPDVVVGVVSSCSSARQCSGQHNVVRAIIQDTIEMELPSLWNSATGDVLIGRCSSSGSNL